MGVVQRVQTQGVSVTSRRILTVLGVIIAIGVVLGGMTVLTGGPAAPAQAQYSGPTEISDWNDLNAVRNDMDGDYVIVNDLNESTNGYNNLVKNEDGALANGGKGWEPIGEFNDEFTGTFNSSGYTISDLEINRPSEIDVGLFGNTDDGATITNVTLTNVGMTGGSDVGGLVGDNDGTVVNSSVSGVMTGDALVGGMAGSNAGMILQSSVSGDVTGEFDVGGLVGFNFETATITESSASGDVTGDSTVGGLVGSNRVTVSESSASGDIIGDTSVGGLIGYNLAGTVTQSSASGDVASNGNFENAIGGLIGVANRGLISNSFAVGDVSGSSDVGGIVGQLRSRLLESDEKAILRDSYYNTETTEQSEAVGTIVENNGTAETRGEVTGLQTSQMQGESAESIMSALDFGTTWQVVINPDDYPELQALPNEEPPVGEYADEQGVVVVDGLLNAIDDWRSGEIDVDLLLDVINAWRSGDPVT